MRSPDANEIAAIRNRNARRNENRDSRWSPTEVIDDVDKMLAAFDERVQFAAAARRDAIEECATIADVFGLEMPMDYGLEVGRRIGKKIRALAAGGPGT